MLKDLFRSKPKYVTVRPTRLPTQQPKREIPDGLWTKCEGCSAMLYNKELEKNLFVCDKCGHHFRISASDRLKLIVDPETFTEVNDELESVDPLRFPHYKDKLHQAQVKTGMTDAVMTGIGRIQGQQVALGFADFGFIGGSMGSVVGERLTRLFELAIEQSLPVVIFSAGGGGARMQEGIHSLMQMAKTSQAVAKHDQAGLLYISVLTDPTMGGVYASFATLADILLSEPGALIGFAGPRIVEETIRQKLLQGFQSSEFALEHGMLDGIVARKELRPTIAKLLRMHG